MNRILTFVLAAAFAALPPAAVAADKVYEWIDASGRVNYSDLPPPPGTASRLVERRVAAGAPDPTLPDTLRKLAADFPVHLYTAENCGDPCERARGLLETRGVPFAETRIATEDDVAAYRRVFGEPDEVPAATVGSQRLRGFEAGNWNAVLDRVGYPREPLPMR